VLPCTNCPGDVGERTGGGAGVAVGGTGVFVGGIGVFVAVGAGVFVAVGTGVLVGVGVGPGPVLLAAYADNGLLENVDPVVHEFGNVVRFAPAFVCDAFPSETARNASVPDPKGLRIAIQYTFPAITLAAGTVIVFQLPAEGAVTVPCVSSVPGLPPPSE
jgi:hypothetical protein